MLSEFGRGVGLFLAVTLLVACSSDPLPGHGTAATGGTGGSSGSSSSGGSGATLIDMGSGPEGPWSCTAGGVIVLPAVPVRGTVTGDAVSGTLCAGGIAAMAQDFTNPDTGETVTALLFTGSADALPRFEFDTPSGVDAANIEGRIGIGSGDPQPGTFTNEDSCGAFVFGGSTPSSPVLFLYGAAAASNCESASILKQGSWSLTIDSLTPVPQDSGGNAYITHGHLLLTVEQTFPPETADFDLEF